MDYSMHRALGAIYSCCLPSIDRVSKIITADIPINTPSEAQFNALFKTVFTYSEIFLVMEIIEIL